MLLTTALLASGLAGAVAPRAKAAGEARTVVALTFTSGNVTQYNARAILSSHNMRGTFYVPSGWVDGGSSSTMSWGQLRDLYRDGNEVGGMGTDHKDLTTLSTADATKQVCGDRERLAALGFDPQTFAYPAAAVNDDARSVVRSCGYLSGRTIGGLSATSGPYAETLPPADPYRIRTANLPTAPITLSSLQTAVNAAAANGGGLLPISFNSVCVSGTASYTSCMGTTRPIDSGVLSDFLNWLSSPGTSGHAPAGTTVETLRQALGAPPQPEMPPTPTTVSLTFNDGLKAHYDLVRPLLKSRALKGTFYLSSGQIDNGFACCMAWWQVDDLYRDGNEIGGMGLNHKDLTSLSTADATAEVCDDRKRLVALGYDAVSFAYVQGAYDAAVKTVVAECGYRTARTIGGLQGRSVVVSETQPPLDPFAVRTPNTASSTGPLTLTDLQANVSRVSDGGGGWVPILFTNVCEPADSVCLTSSARSVSTATLSSFLEWLSAAGQAGGAPVGTEVRTVREAMGLAPQPVLPPRPLNVSLTFDDATTSQLVTSQILADRGMRATYYVPSENRTMSWTQIGQVRDAGHDIGGHTLNHTDVTGPQYTYDQKYREVCADRQTLQDLGFDPVSFAYPFGASNAEAESIVQACGYQTGRRAGGVNVAGPVYAESLPPRSPYRVRTLFRAETSPIQASELKNAVNAAFDHGGGWLVLVFHEICATGDSACLESGTYKPIAVDQFTEFVDWLKNDAPSSVRVGSVREVFEGGVPVPRVTVDAPSSGYVNSLTPTFVGTASGAADVMLRVYAGPYATGSPVTTVAAPVQGGRWSATITSSLEDGGTYTVVAEEPNSVGKVGSSAPVTFGVDATSPALTMTTPTEGAVTNATPAFGGYVGIAVADSAHVTLRLYAGPTPSATPVQTPTVTVENGEWWAQATSLASGTYTAVATQSDAAGNTTTASVTFTVNPTAPRVTVTWPVDGTSLNTSTPTIAGSAGADPGDSAMVMVKIYNGPSATGTPLQTLSASVTGGDWSATPAPLTEGTYTVVASQSNSLGNVGTSAPVTFTVDMTSPTVSITSPAAGAVVNTTAIAGTAGIGAGDGSATLTMYYGTDDTGPVAGIYALELDAQGRWAITPAVADGTYTAVVDQIDAAGNAGSASRTFSVDSAPPAPSVTSPADGTATSNNQPTLWGAAGTAPGDDSSVTVELYSTTDGSGEAQTMSAAVSSDGHWSVVFGTLLDGPYSIRVSQGDAAGNVRTSPLTSFRVDTAAPALTLRTPEDGAYVTISTPAFSGAAGTAFGDSSSVEVRVYAGSDTTTDPLQSKQVAVETGSWTTTPAALADGSYTVLVRQTDSAGNATSKSARFTVDTSAPVVVLISPDPEASPPPTYSTSVSVSGTATEATDVTVRVLNAAGVVAATQTVRPDAGGAWSTSIVGLADGSYTVQASQSDAAGNTGSSAVAAFDVSAPVAVTGVTPASVGQGAVGVVLTVTGSGFDANPTVSISGSGVAVRSLIRDSATSLAVTVDVDSAAATGRRSVTVANQDGKSGTCSGCLTISAGPKVTGVSPTSLQQGAESQAVTISASGVTTGTTATLGHGVRILKTAMKSTSIVLTVSVDQNTATGPRDVVVTNPDGGRAVLAGGFTVTAGPTVSAVTPATAKRDATTTLTITGTNFASGATVKVSGTGVSTGKVTFVNSTTLTVPVSVARNAATTARDVTVVNPTSVGAGQGTNTAALTIT